MTKPTEEQIKALRPGARVLVEMIIRKANDQDGDCYAAYNGYRGKDIEAWPHLDAIHSILPREIKVGDRVRTGDGDEWEVAAPPRVSQVSAREEVVVWSTYDGYSCAWVDELEVIA
jgi:hypothetical protein